MSEEPKYEIRRVYPPDILEPSFDMDAYRRDLLEVHAEHMREISEGKRITAHIQPPELDPYSEKYDVDADIAYRLNAARGDKRLEELKKTVQLMVEQAQEPEDTPRARDIAVMQGALTTIGERLAIPSTQDFEDIFSPNKVKIIPTGYAANESGKISLPSNADIKSAWKANAAKMAALLQMSVSSYENGEQRIQVYLPSVCRELSIDPRGYSTKREADGRTIKEQRFDAFTNWFAPLEAYMLPLNGEYYRACTIEKYNELSETVTLNPPFFLRLLEVMQEIQTKHAQLNRYFHADVANEENVSAIYVAVYLTNNLLQRGQHNPDDTAPKFTYRVSYATIISKCPQLEKELADITARPLAPGEKDTRTQAYNMKLKRVFETAYRIILEKTDFPKLFVDLKINGVSEWEDPASKKRRKTEAKEGSRRIASKRFNIPTKTKLNTKLKITHNGRNTAFAKD